MSGCLFFLSGWIGWYGMDEQNLHICFQEVVGLQKLEENHRLSFLLAVHFSSYLYNCYSKNLLL